MKNLALAKNTKKKSTPIEKHLLCFALKTVVTKKHIFNSWQAIKVQPVRFDCTQNMGRVNNGKRIATVIGVCDTDEYDRYQV